MDEQEIYLKKLKFKGTLIRTNRWEYKTRHKIRLQKYC